MTRTKMRPPSIVGGGVGEGVGEGRCKGKRGKGVSIRVQCELDRVGSSQLSVGVARLN